MTLLLTEAASAAAAGKTDLAETLYKQALKKAEDNDHRAVRQISLEMAAFYEQIGQHDLAEQARKRAAGRGR